MTATFFAVYVMIVEFEVEPHSVSMLLLKVLTTTNLNITLTFYK